MSGGKAPDSDRDVVGFAELGDVGGGDGEAGVPGSHAHRDKGGAERHHSETQLNGDAEAGDFHVVEGEGVFYGRGVEDREIDADRADLAGGRAFTAGSFTPFSF